MRYVACRRGSSRRAAARTANRIDESPTAAQSIAGKLDVNIQIGDPVASIDPLATDDATSARNRVSQPLA
jgi:hypothetical protein